MEGDIDSELTRSRWISTRIFVFGLHGLPQTLCFWNAITWFTCRPTEYIQSQAGGETPSSTREVSNTIIRFECH
jgi:hypothetical protein